MEKEKIPIKEIEFFYRDKRTHERGWISFDEILDTILKVKKKEKIKNGE
jgi:hypothetical protein